jgi:HKD family nuclease
MESFIRNLNYSLQEGFIDKSQSNSGSFKPELLINNVKKNINVLNTLQEELETSEDFIFSVAFVTESGLATMKSLFLLK